jgi:hypothetical protein
VLQSRMSWPPATATFTEGNDVMSDATKQYLGKNAVLDAVEYP